MYPLHQTVLLNPYLPQMQTSFLKQFPVIDEEPETERKFASLNTRAVKRPHQFQSMRIVRKRNIERFYPNTEYGDNFTEINNNENSESEGNKDENSDNIIYENFPALLKIKSDISGVEKFDNLTDSIQIYEEPDDLSASTNSLRPIPAPRTKKSPFASPVKTDHVYVNLSMPLISTKLSKSFDIVDAPVRPSKSAENIPILKNDSKKEDSEKEDESDNDEDGTKSDIPKPNIVGATPKKNLSTILPSTSLVKSMVEQLNDKGMNKVGLPKKTVIAPNKTLQIPKLTEKPVPKRSIIRRSNSVQSSLSDSQVYRLFCFIFVTFFFKLCVDCSRVCRMQITDFKSADIYEYETNYYFLIESVWAVICIHLNSCFVVTNLLISFSEY